MNNLSNTVFIESCDEPFSELSRHVSCLKPPSMPSLNSSKILSGVSVTSNGASRKPYIIGIVGGTNSGKTTVCKKIIRELKAMNDGRSISVASISQDSFYRDLNPEQMILAKKSEYNFDHPDTIDDEEIFRLLTDLANGKSGKVPEYDFKNHGRTGNFELVQPAEVILIEGIMLFHYKQIREFCDMKLFIDCDADTRLARRVKRDTAERGRSIENIIKQYTGFVKPSYDEYCAPTKKYADIVVPRGAENDVAINLIICHIQDILKKSDSLKKNGQMNGHTNGQIATATLGGEGDQKRPH